MWKVVRTELCPASSLHAIPLAGLPWALHSIPLFLCTPGFHFMCSPGLRFVCHFRKYSLYSTIHKNKSKNRFLPCRAAPFDRELLITALQLQFSAGLHPFHLHHVFIACLSECHIKRIREVNLWHLLLFLSFQGLLSCQRERLDCLTVCVCDKYMPASPYLFLVLVLRAVCSRLFVVVLFSFLKNWLHARGL